MNPKFGLVPLREKDRGFSVGQIYTLSKLEELPDDFDMGETRTEHQKDSDFCSAYTFTSMSEFQEGVELSPEWHFAMSKELSGNIEEFGQDLKTAAKVSVKYGDIKKEDAPFSLDTKPYTYLRDPAVWPIELKEKALEHKKKTYLDVSGPYSYFDTIRAFLWKFRNEKKCVALGVVFGWPLSQKIMEHPADFGTGHAMYTKGWKKINGQHYLIVVNSYGKETGDNGVHYFSAEVINKTVGLYGAYALTDMTREEVEYMLQNGIKDTNNWLTRLFKVLYTFIKDIFRVKIEA